MRAVIQLLIGGQSNQGAQGQQGAPGKTAPPIRWKESKRTTEVVRVFNPNDHSQFVDVERINQLTMTDGVTGESWSWSREKQ
jgi:hypothetical protein